MLSAALIVAALLAGVAGAWSPCGFSIVDTLAPAGYAGRLRTTLAGAASFAAGALAGGAATFGGLALLGAYLGTGGALAVGIGAALLLAAACGDAAGRRIVPQVRRQVPEGWRRWMPVPLAAGLYGVLLGLGFTTFVLSFACYALAAACLAFGDPGLGLAVGLAFGAGRAIPVVLLAPAQEREWGATVAAAMAERPAILRGLRAAAAAALAAAGAGLLATPAEAAQLVARNASDPSAAAGALAWEQPDGTSMLRRRGGRVVGVPGEDAAISPRLIAWRRPDTIVIGVRSTLRPLYEMPAPGVDALAISDTHLVWRARGQDGRDRIWAANLLAPQPEYHTVLARAPLGTAELGRPSIDETTVVFHLAAATEGSRLLAADLTTGELRLLRRRRGELLLNPSTLGGQLAYVRSTARRQQLVLGPLDLVGFDRVIASTTPTARRDSGVEGGRRHHRAGYRRGRRPRAPRRPPAGVTVTWWTTALAPGYAYLTQVRALPGGGRRSTLVRVAR